MKNEMPASELLRTPEQLNAKLAEELNNLFSEVSKPVSKANRPFVMLTAQVCANLLHEMVHQKVDVSDEVLKAIPSTARAVYCLSLLNRIIGAYQ